jgi:glycerol kinase
MQRVAPLQRIVVSGGLAACDYLCEVIAEASGLPVERPHLHEASARGIAFLAAGQPQEWQRVRIEKSFEPTDSDVVTERFERWRKAMAQRGAVS